MKTKCTFFTPVIALVAFVFCSGCPAFDTSHDNSNNSENERDYLGNYSKDYWGEWIRMDTGENWYISDTALTVDGEKRKTVSVSLKKQSSRVIEVSEAGRRYYLYASRVNNGTFFGSIANHMAGAGRSVARAISGIGGINIVIKNLGNAADQTTASTNSSGGFEFAGTPGDSYAVTVNEQETVVTTNASGGDIGTITVATGLNFKTRITSTADMQALFPGINYNFVIEIENTGTVDCTAAQYALSLDSGLELVSGETTGILRTIEPGKSRTIPLTFRGKRINTEYEFKRIDVWIMDSLNGNVWNDSVSVKINAGLVNLAIRSETPVNGVVITPHGKAYHFNCTYHESAYGRPGPTCRAAVTVPWSNDDYLVVFSGATADTESAYTLGVNMPNPDGNYKSFLNVMNYEPNNTEANAVGLTGSEPIMSYLHKNDIDYFSVNVGSSVPVLRTLAVLDCACASVQDSKDRKLVPGKQFRMDLDVVNAVPLDGLNYNFELSTSSPYVTIDRGTGKIENLVASDKYSYWKYGTLSFGRYGWEADYLFDYYNSDKDFRFTISSDCPRGAKLPFTIRITDSLGNQWTESVVFSVE